MDYVHGCFALKKTLIRLKIEGKMMRQRIHYVRNKKKKKNMRNHPEASLYQKHTAINGLKRKCFRALITTNKNKKKDVLRAMWGVWSPGRVREEGSMLTGSAPSGVKGKAPNSQWPTPYMPPLSSGANWSQGWRLWGLDQKQACNWRQ